MGGTFNHQTTLPPGSFDIFDKDLATFWQDCLSRLQAPRVISK